MSDCGTDGAVKEAVQDPEHPVEPAVASSINDDVDPSAEESSPADPEAPSTDLPTPSGTATEPKAPEQPEGGDGANDRPVTKNPDAASSVKDEPEQMEEEANAHGAQSVDEAVEDAAEDAENLSIDSSSEVSDDTRDEVEDEDEEAEVDGHDELQFPDEDLPDEVYAEETKRFTALARSILTATNPHDPCQEVARLVALATQRLDEDKPATNIFRYFVGTIFPACVRFALSCDPIPSLAGHVNDFLQTSLRFIVRCYALNAKEHASALAHILGAPIHDRANPEGSDDRNRFYKDLGRPKLRKVKGKSQYYWPQAKRKQTADDGDVKDEVEMKLEFAGDSAVGRQTSYYLIANINYFGEIGGFTKLYARIRDTEHPLSVTMLFAWLHALSECRHVVNPDFMKQLACDVRDSLFDHLTSLPPQSLKAISKPVITKLFTIVERFLAKAGYSSSEMSEMTELFELRFALYLLECPYLEKRIQGMNDIKDLIEMAMKKEEYEAKRKGAYAYFTGIVRTGDPSPSFTRLWVTTEYLCDWLLENKLLDKVLNAQAHMEIVRRVPQALVLLSVEGKLTTKHLDAVWGLACAGKHESEEHLIYDILSQLSPRLTLQQLRYLFNQISTTKPFAEYDKQLLLMVKRLTLEAYRKAKASDHGEITDWYGLNLFWVLAQHAQGEIEDATETDAEHKESTDPIPMNSAAPSVASSLGKKADKPPPDVARAALNLFLDLLGTDSAISQRGPYTEKCVMNLQSGSSVPQSLALLVRILKTYPQTAKGWFSGSKTSMWSIIEALQTKYNLIDLCLVHMQKIKEQKPVAKRHIAQSAQSIRVIQSFLTFVLSNSSLQLSRAQIDAIWDSMVKKALTAKERDSCFQWLMSASGSLDGASASFAELSDETREYLYSKCLRLDPATLTAAGYRLVQHMFLLVKQANGGLVTARAKAPAKEDTKENRNNDDTGEDEYDFGDEHSDKSHEVDFAKIQVVNYSSIVDGVQVLFDILLYTDDHAVADDAHLLLNCLHQNFSRKVKASMQNEVREWFLRLALGLLGSSLGTVTTETKPPDSAALQKLFSLLRRNTQRMTQLSEDARHRVSHRLLLLLKKFLEAFRSSQRKGNSFSLLVIPDSSLGPAPFAVELPSSATTEDLEKAIAAELRACYCDVTAQTLALSINRKPVVEKVALKAVNFLEEAEPDQYIVRVARQPSLIKRRLSPLEDALSQQTSAVLDAPLPSLDVLQSASMKTAKKPLDVKHGALESVAKDEALFSRLFALLTPKSAFATEVWDLLKLLPISDASYAFVRSTKDWSTALDSSSRDGGLYTVLYSLKIVDKIASPQWRAGFVENGGCKAIIHLITHMSPDTTPEANKIYTEIFGVCSRVLSQCLRLSSEYKSLQEEKATAAVIESTLSESEWESFIFKGLVPALTRVANGGVTSTPEAEASFTEAAALLLVDVLSSFASIMNAFMQHENASQCLLCVLLVSRTAAARSAAAVGLHRLSKADAGFAAWLYQQLVQFSEANQPLRHRDRCEEYYCLLGTCIHDLVTGGAADTHVESVLKVVDRVIADLNAQTSTEEFVSQSAIDHYVRGIVRLLRFVVLCKAIPSDSTETLLSITTTCYNRLLFDLPQVDNRNGCLCKAPATRAEGYSLLVELFRTYKFCFDHLSRALAEDQMWARSKPSINYQPSALARVKKFAGLKNQGATCYMNSFLQLLYMIPAFRTALLHTQVMRRTDAPSAPEEDHTGLVTQLQMVFAHLQYSPKKFYDTLSLCRSFKDEDGHPMRLTEQKDVNEFASMLFDRMETGLSHTTNPSLLERTFKGKLIHQMISKECDHTSSRDEEYFMLSLPVKNKRNVREAFELYIEGDLLDGDNKFMCGPCKTKVTALKRACVKTLPPYLILHLKRFEFDFDTMTKMKVNDRFEFPMVLDMYPFTLEGILEREAEEDDTVDTSQVVKQPAAHYKFELVGILVHAGMADAGHYFSYIRSEQKGENGKHGWFEFNDTAVRTFEESSIPDACFGGKELTDTYNHQTHRKEKKTVDKTRNAYMLVYKQTAVPASTNEKTAVVESKQDAGVNNQPTATEEPIASTDADAAFAESQEQTAAPEVDTDTPTPESAPAPETDSDSPATDAATDTPAEADAKEPASADKQKGQYVLPDESLPDDLKQMVEYTFSKDVTSMPVDVVKSLWNDCQVFASELQLFDGNFQSFLWRLGQAALAALHDETTPEMEASFAHVAQCCTLYTFDVQTRSLNSARFPAWVKFLRKCVKSSKAYRTWLLDRIAGDTFWTTSCLLHCVHSPARDAFADLLQHSLETHLEDEEEAKMLFDEKEMVVLDQNTGVEQTVYVPTSSVPRCVQALLTRLSTVKQYYTSYQQYFRLLYEFAKISPMCTRYLLSRRLVLRLTSFYTDRRILLKFNYRRNWSRANAPPIRIHPPNTLYALQLLAHLVENSATHTLKDDHLYPLPEDETNYLLLGVDPDLEPNANLESPLPFMMSETHHSEAVLKIVLHWCRANLKLSLSIINAAVVGIQDQLGNTANYKPYFRILHAIMMLDDGKQTRRIRHTYTKLARIASRLLERRDFGDDKLLMFVVKALLRVAACNTAAGSMLLDMQESMNWRQWSHKFNTSRSYR